VVIRRNRKKLAVSGSGKGFLEEEGSDSKTGVPEMLHFN
jgi:hypothetical protein